MYAKWQNGLMLISNEPREGYKPMVQTPPLEAPSGRHAAFFWKETETAWEQTWDLEPDHDDVSDSEALSILLGGAT